MFVRTLVVTEDLDLPQRLRVALPAGAELLQACSPAEIEDRLSREVCDLVLVGADALGDEPKAVLARIRGTDSAAEVVVLQRREVAEQRAALLAAGCLGVVPDELSPAGLRRALGAFVARRRETMVLHSYLKTQSDGDLQACRSRSMTELLEIADRVGAGSTPVLILGETGSGKEWLARHIHRSGERTSGAFVAVNCAAVPATLWESELFGHERGAFTGADRTRRGRFETAHGGTLFLDEVGETPAVEQAKLLRAVETGEVQRVGSDETLAVDARIVSATNRDLEDDVAAGRFRRDLLSLGRGHAPCAASAQQAGRSGAAGASAPGTRLPAPRPPAGGLHRGWAGGPCRLFLAGQRARAGQRRRACGIARRRRRNRCRGAGSAGEGKAPRLPFSHRLPANCGTRPRPASPRRRQRAGPAHRARLPPRPVEAESRGARQGRRALRLGAAKPPPQDA